MSYVPNSLHPNIGWFIVQTVISINQWLLSWIQLELKPFITA